MNKDIACLAQNNIIYFIFANIMLLLACSFNNGFFLSPLQIFLVGLSLLSLSLPLINFRILDIYSKITSTRKLILLGTLINFIIFLAIDSGVYRMVANQTTQVLVSLIMISLIIFTFYLKKEDDFKANPLSRFLNNILKHKFIYLVALAIIMRIILVLASPNPDIDVFNVANEQVDNLVAGKNPYSSEYTSPWINWKSNPSYLPSIIFLNIPGRLLFGDVRFGYIFAHIIIASIIYLLLNKKYKHDKIINEVPVLMFLYLPTSLYVLRQTWIEPLILLALSSFIFLYFKNKASYITWIILGLSISLKQNYFPLFFLALSNFKPKIKEMAAMIITLVLSVSPFLIWDYKSFIAATITNVMKFGSIFPTVHSISLNSVFLKYYKHDIPFLYSFTALLIILFLLILKTKKHDIANFVHLSIVFLLSTFVIIWGFPNYYYFISGSMVLLIVLELLKLPTAKIERLQ